MQQLAEETDHPELSAFLAEHHSGLATIELKYKGRRVGGWTLATADGEPVGPGQTPSESVPTLVALVEDAAETHAAKHGAGSFRVLAQPARGARGPAPAARGFTFACGEQSVRERVDEHAFTMFKQLSALHFTTLDKMMSLVDVVRKGYEDLSSAQLELLRAREGNAENAMTMKLLESQERAAARREALAAGTLKPFLAAAQAAWFKTSPQQLPPSAQNSNAAQHDALVVKARALYASLSDTQRDTIAAAAPPLRALLDAMAREVDPAAIVRAVADAMELPMEELHATLSTLGAEQETALADLIDHARGWTAPAAEPAPA